MVYIALMIGPDEPASTPPTPLLIPVKGFEVKQPTA